MRDFAMRLEIKLRCILFPLIILEMFLQLDRKELSIELQDRIVSWHRSGEGYQTSSAALKVPKNTVASIIRKWKNPGTTKTLSRAGHLAKLRNHGEKGLGQAGDQEPDGHSERAPEFL